MNTPVPSLMKRYGTEEVFLEKAAGAEPLLMRLGASLLNAELAHKTQQALSEQELENELYYRAAQEHQLAQLSQATNNLRHTDVPMVRLASIAAGTGADMAKVAGFGNFEALAKMVSAKIQPTFKGIAGAIKPAAGAAPAAGNLLDRGKKYFGGGLGLKTNLALGGAAIGGTLLASKAMRGAGRAMASETAGPATYGGAVNGVGYQMPYGVNQYGQAQVGTPLG